MSSEKSMSSDVSIQSIGSSTKITGAEEKKAIKKRKFPNKSKILTIRTKGLPHKNVINQTGNTKTQIIKNILKEERKELRQNKSRLKTAKGASRAREVNSKGKIEKNPYKKLNALKSKIESEDDLPLAIRLLSYNSKPKPPPVQLPEISRSNWHRFRKEVGKKETGLENIKAKKCLDRMRSYRMFDLHYNALYFIRKAIVDSLLSRKWDNLVKLLIMLIKNYSDPVFTVFIRHICEILKYYHPRIRGTELENQIELIMEKYEKKRNSRLN